MDVNIEVAIRVRPLLNKELSEGLPVHWHIDGKNIFQTDEHGKPSHQPFRFDHIFDGLTTNIEIFEAVVRPMIRSGMAGYNATVFAYGQTASGKTYTMLGSDTRSGIIPLTIRDIFETINKTPERKFLLRLSYIEIYNDVLKDLLDTTPKTIKICEDSNGVIHLNVDEKVIHTPEEAQAVLKESEKRRKYGATNANQHSSRSHTIFRIIIESTPLSDDPDSDLPVHVSHLNLVDLAGSERVSQTKATGIRLREGAQINKSLHLLSLVIRQLSEGKDFTNFRDSKLTRILKDSLGGNAKTLIIGAISPTSIEDSHSTLTFTYQAKKIKNKPTINEVVDSDSLTKQYIMKEKELRKQLAKMAQDKKELEDKHMQTIDMLTDKLHYFKHQFIVGTNTTPTKQETNRRHTIGSVQKINKLRLRKEPSPPRTTRRSTLLESNVIPSNQEFKQFDKIYKTPHNISSDQRNSLRNDENQPPETTRQKNQINTEYTIIEEEESEYVTECAVQSESSNVKPITEIIDEQQVIFKTLETIDLTESENSTTEYEQSDLISPITTSIETSLNNLNYILCTDLLPSTLNEGQEDNENLLKSIFEELDKEKKQHMAKIEELSAKDKIIEKLQQDLTELESSNLLYRQLLHETEVENNKSIQRLSEETEIIIELHNRIKQQEELILNVKKENQLLEDKILESSTAVKTLQETIQEQKSANLQLSLKNDSLEEDFGIAKKEFAAKVEQLRFEYSKDKNILEEMVEKETKTQIKLSKDIKSMNIELTNLLETNANLNIAKKAIESNYINLKQSNETRHIKEAADEIFNLKIKNLELARQVARYELKPLASSKEAKNPINQTELKLHEEISKSKIAYCREQETNQQLLKKIEFLQTQVAEKNALISKNMVNEISHSMEKDQLMKDIKILQSQIKYNRDYILKLQATISKLKQTNKSTYELPPTLMHDSNGSETPDDVKLLRDSLVEKDKKIEVLDKSIIKLANHVVNLNKLFAKQETQIEKLKEEHISQGTSRTAVKNRRSFTQDTSRNLEEIVDDETTLCSICEVTSSKTVNDALFRETHRQASKIKEVEHKLSVTQKEYTSNFKRLDDDYKTLQFKYNQLKELAIMRRDRIKKLEEKKE